MEKKRFRMMTFIAIVIINCNPPLFAQNIDSKILAGTATNSQLWVSDDGGKTWDMKVDFSSVADTKVVMSQTYDPYHDRLVAGLHGIKGYWQIWTSADGGETWKMKKQSDPNPEITGEYDLRTLTYNSDNHKLIAGTIGFYQSEELTGEIWVSSDGGETWEMKKDFSTISPAGQGIKSLAYDSYHKMVIAGTANRAQIWTSSDGGETWEMKKDLYQEAGQIFVSALIFDPYHRTIVAGTCPDAQIWQSTNGGNTWILSKDLKKSHPGQDRVYGTVFVPEKNRLLIGVGFTHGAIWASEDGGYTWSLKKDFTVDTGLPVLNAVLSLAYDVNRKKVLAGTSDIGQIWASGEDEAYGDSWALIKDFSQEDLPQTHVFSLAVYPNTGQTENNSDQYMARDGSGGCFIRQTAIALK